MIALKTLQEFCKRPGRGDTEKPLLAWYREAKSGNWSSWEDIKARFRSADWVGNNRVVFDIGGNKYRLVARVNFDSKTVFIAFVGTHQDYDRLPDVKEVKQSG